MSLIELNERHFETSMTRRRVVGTGVKLAYAAPLVAASFKLTASGALAQELCACPPVDVGGQLFPATPDPDAPGCRGAGCCICACTTDVFTYDPATNSCIGLQGDICTPDCTCCPRTT